MNAITDITTPGLRPQPVILPGGASALFCFQGLDRALPERAQLAGVKARQWRAQSWPVGGGFAGVAVVSGAIVGNFDVDDPLRDAPLRVAVSETVSTEAADLAAFFAATEAPAPALLHFLGAAMERVGALAGAQRFLADLLMQTATPDGYVELIAHPEDGLLYLQGWTRSGLAGPLTLHGLGDGVTAMAAGFARADVPDPATGLCLLAEVPRAEVPATLFVDHEARLLRLDVVPGVAPVSGAGAFDHLRAVLPRLTGPETALDAFRRAARPRFAGENTLAGHAGPVAAALDRLIVTPAGGVFVAGWLLDPLDQVAEVRLKSSAGLDARLDARWHRTDRPDLAEAFGTDPRFAGRLDPRACLYGFACAVQAEPGRVEAAGLYLEVVLADETCLFLPCEALPVQAEIGAAAVMALLAPHDPGLGRLIADHAAPFLATLPAPALGPGRMSVQPLAGGLRGRAVTAVMPLAEIAHLQPILASLADTADAEGLDLVVVANREGAAGLGEDLDHQFRFFGLSGALVLLPGHETLGRRLDAGAQAAAGGELLVWQPAVLPRAPGWLAALRRAAAGLGEGAVVAPLLSYEDGSVYFGGGTGAVPQGAPCALVGFDRRQVAGAAPRAAQALPAEMLLVSRDRLAAAGGFSGGLLGARYLGQDLSQRLAAAGARAWCIPEAEFWMLDAADESTGETAGAPSLIDRIDAALVARRPAPPPVDRAPQIAGDAA